MNNNSKNENARAYQKPELEVFNISIEGSIICNSVVIPIEEDGSGDEWS